MNHESKDETLDDLVIAALRKTEYLLPATEDEIEDILAEEDSDQIEVPGDAEIIRRLRTRERPFSRNRSKKNPDLPENDEMSLAARKGKSLSSETLEKMGEDRKRAIEKMKKENGENDSTST